MLSSENTNVENNPTREVGRGSLCQAVELILVDSVCELIDPEQNANINSKVSHVHLSCNGGHGPSRACPCYFDTGQSIASAKVTTLKTNIYSSFSTTIFTDLSKHLPVFLLGTENIVGDSGSGLL